MDVEKIKERVKKTGFSEEEIIIIEWLNDRTGEETEKNNISLADTFEDLFVEEIGKAKKNKENGIKNPINVDEIRKKAANTNFTLEQAIVFDWLGKRSAEELEKGNTKLSDILLEEQFAIGKTTTNNKIR